MADSKTRDRVNGASAVAGVPGAWRERLCVWGEGLRTGLWPVPVLMGLGAFGLHALAAWLDRRVGEFSFPGSGWLLHSGTGQDAYVLLATLVSALVTVASIVFSITIVTLTVAANQFGSRLVRTYMSTRAPSSRWACSWPPSSTACWRCARSATTRRPRKCRT